MIVRRSSTALVLTEVLAPASAPAVDRWSVRQVSNTLGYTMESVQGLVQQVPTSDRERSNQCAAYRELLAFTLADLVGILPDEVAGQVKTILAAHDVIVHRALAREGR